MQINSEKVINIPHLPTNEVKSVVMSVQNKQLVSRVEELGIKIIPTDKIKSFAEYENTHSDMQMLQVDDKTVFVADECTSLIANLVQYFEKVIPIKFLCSNKNICSYPHNILLNSVVINNKLFCKKTLSSAEIVKTFENKNYNIISINQGYAKCSTSIVNDSAIITADSSIYKAAINNGFDVLKITNGDIKLNGVNYGFIGGACGKLDKDILAFCGNIKMHRDYENIKCFCKNHGVNLLSLDIGELVDIGGILPITEKTL